MKLNPGEIFGLILGAVLVFGALFHIVKFCGPYYLRKFRAAVKAWRSCK